MYCVFIVDNEHFAALYLKQLFHRPDLGFECTRTFTNAKDAALAILASPPDLIVSDIRMPRMNGLEFMKYLSERNVPSRIILVSAFSDFSYAQEALRGGALDYLNKPVSKADVEKCILRIKEILDKERSYTPENSFPSPGKKLSESENGDITMEMKRFLERHYAEPVRLKDLADYVHLNASYCSVLFQKSFGISFSKYLINMRMEKAQKLLQSKSLSVSQAGILVGYPDLSYFSKEFKKKYGITPTEYKAKQL
ncbi:MAG: response regulator [Lachnospiraceae bacterium]|jgi:two-component system response regulator YesN|nr:response regulator [Lachnospiraceae bacterium]